MKIKRSVLKKILRNIFFGLESIDSKVKKFKKNMKKGVKGLFKFGNHIVKDYEAQLEKIGLKSDVITYTKEELEFFISDGEGNLTPTTFEGILKSISKESKEIKSIVKPVKKDQCIDEYSGKKFIINDMIKSLYFKAKELVIAINGVLLKVNEEYRKAVDKFLEIRTNLRDRSYQMLKENKFLLKFVLDNNVDTDEEYDLCLDILAKMYIAEKEQNLYNSLKEFSEDIEGGFAF